MYVVYVHKFPNNKVYVGITGNRYPKKRWSCGNGYKTQQLMWRAIQKYGWDNIEHEIVAKNLTHEDACRLEIKLIKQYKSNNSDYGYNVSSGGDGANGIKLSKDRIEKLRAVNTGRAKKPGEVDKIKKSLSEYWTDDVRKEFGKKHGGNGFKLSEDIALSIYNRLCDGDSRKLLANEFNVSKAVIDRIAQKKYWSIRNSNSPILQRKLPTKYIYQLTESGEFVNKWNTFDEIHKALGINVGTICECCNHKRCKTNGFIWRYVLICDNEEEIYI